MRDDRLETPKGLRWHIGLFGRRNSGKSTLINALLGQAASIVSERPGTTTDPVEKACELAPLGPVVLIDTAGLDDQGALGELRVKKTREVLERVDVVLLVIDADGPGALEDELIAGLRAQRRALLVVFNKSDQARPTASRLARFADEGIETATVSAKQGHGLDALREALFRLVPAEGEESRLIGDLLDPGELVVLVAPLDSGAPKGRLILPQVQTLRDILDGGAIGVLLRESEFAPALARLNGAPKLVVCDSQVVRKIAVATPPDILLTTFSILMARAKGDMIAFAAGAGAITRLRPGDQVLIAEACSHHAQADDIGRVKIPRWLSQSAGGPLAIEFSAGGDFPTDLSPYALIVQCGGCMATRRQTLVRQYRAARQGVPMTNYGMAISVAQGVLERSLECFPAAWQAYQGARAGVPAISATSAISAPAA